MADAPQPQPGEAGPEHDHTLDALHGAASSAQAAAYAVAILGLLCNLLLLCLTLCQRHTRRLRSAFLVHSAGLNLLMSCLTLAFARGLGPDGISSSSCGSLTTGYIVFLTVWVFNLVPTVCCEIYYLDSGAGRPRGSGCCVAFGICLVYLGSAILHLGPTLIGANFEWQAKNTRCLFLHGHPKNYTVYLMWIVIATVALGITGYYLVTFRRAIDRSMRARLRAAVVCGGAGAGAGGTERKPGSVGAAHSLVTSDALLASRLADLADIKLNRQRVLCGVCGVFVVCWYPLYLLVLSDPRYKAPVQLFQLLTGLGFAKTILEPLVIAGFDRSVGRPLMRLWPCTRRLRYVGEDEIDARLAAAAAAGCPERSDSTSVIASASTVGFRRPPQHPMPQHQQHHLQQQQQQQLLRFPPTMASPSSSAMAAAASAGPAVSSSYAADRPPDIVLSGSSSPISF